MRRGHDFPTFPTGFEEHNQHLLAAADAPAPPSVTAPSDPFAEAIAALDVADAESRTRFVSALSRTQPTQPMIALIESLFRKSASSLQLSDLEKAHAVIKAQVKKQMEREAVMAADGEGGGEEDLEDDFM